MPKLVGNGGGGWSAERSIPLPRVASRWTKAKRAQFLEVLANTARVTYALRETGMSVSGLYELRKRDPAFRAQWDEVIDAAHARLEAVVLDRALNAANDETVKPLSDAATIALLSRHTRIVAEERTRTKARMMDTESARKIVLRQLNRLIAHARQQRTT